MEFSKSITGLFLHEKQRTCVNQPQKFETGFKSIYLQNGDVLPEMVMSCNNILMVISGEVKASCGVFRSRIVAGGNMVLIPRGSSLSMIASCNTEILLFGFNTLLNLCDRMRREKLHGYCADIQYDFLPTPIRSQLHAFIGLLKYYLDNDMNCAHLFMCKHYEFFICMDAFYSKGEVASLLYPILGASAGFRALVMESYEKVANVNELVDLSGMGKTKFYEVFKREFGITAKQWMLQHKVELLHSAAIDPALSVKDIMYICGFDNPSLFYRFCCQQFGKSPKEAIGTLREGIQLRKI